jgi:hypothetical protein
MSRLQITLPTFDSSKDGPEAALNVRKVIKGIVNQIHVYLVRKLSWF